MKKCGTKMAKGGKVKAAAAASKKNKIHMQKEMAMGMAKGGKVKKGKK